MPPRVGRSRTRSHDCIRHGAIALCAALNYLEGKVISRTASRHTPGEWLRLLKQIDHEAPQELDMHLIADNYRTHQHAQVRAWLDKHRRFHMRCTPPPVSWLNWVERFFADLPREVVREGSFRSVRQLARETESYLAESNKRPQRYQWKAQGEDIPAEIHRAKIAMEQSPQ